MIRFRIHLLAAAFFGCAVDPTRCFDFNFPMFATNDQLQLDLSGDSYFFKDVVQVTWGLRGALITNAHGRAVFNKPFRLRNRDEIASFYTTFVITISPQTSPVGGEGLAFILAANASSPAHSDGQWLGIVNASTNETPEAKIVAIEFDTRKNFPQDIDDNHVGLNMNSIFSIVQRPLLNFGVNLSSAEPVFGIIKYDGENISIFVSMSNKTEDQLKNRVIFQPLNLSILPEEVYVGFSASTSNYTQLNCVRSWQFHGTDVGGKRRLWVWLTVAGVVLAVMLCGAGIVFYFRVRERRLNHSEDPYGGIEHQLQDFSIAPRARKFGLRELKKATGNFDPKNKLGRGGFGTVYKGTLMNKEVAVKRISKDSRQGKQEFVAEVATIGSLHHKNLVKLIGCAMRRGIFCLYTNTCPTEAWTS